MKTSAQAISLPSAASGHAQSVQQILAERNSSIFATHLKSDGVVAVGFRELLVQYPKVKTEDDVDIAADILVKIFNSPRSRRFYCDCARHLDRSFITQAAFNANETRTKKSDQKSTGIFRADLYEATYKTRTI